ncbi:MAG TPA: hypothetical protein VME43_33600 [Bryobacteraceae bacterium]|nr:hypothetical protein [Bryobacteraceae bacterium]
MISDDRQKWKDVKQKHNAALKQAKVDFNKGLGKALDRMYAKIGKNDAEAKKIAIETAKLIPVYEAKINSLHDPAKKDLREVLEHIEKVLNEVGSWKA